MIGFFRPFWSYNILATESWLTSMSEQGFQLADFNSRTRRFYFVKAFHSQPSIYRISYAKQDVLPPALLEEGWKMVVHKGKWHILQHEQSNEIATYPEREGVIRRNKRLMYLFAALLIYFSFALLPLVFMFMLFITTGELNVSVEGNPFAVIIGMMVPVLLSVYACYFLVKLNKANKQLLFGKEKGIYKWRRKSYKKQANFSRGKLAWKYAPDRLEAWLENMALAGNELIAVSRFGARFYFRRTKPKHIRYCVDYQNHLDDAYFDLHRQAGWALLYSQTGFLDKWSIWAKVYEQGEAVPQLYDDGGHKLKHARRVTITHVAFLIPAILVYVYIFRDFALYNGDTFKLLVFGIIIIQFTAFFIQSSLYYKRMKKKVERY